MIPSYETSKKGKPIETENRLVLVWNWGGNED